MDDVTQLLARWSGGDLTALDELIPRVYGELRKLAASYLRHERADHTLQPTALIHEAYLRLAGLRDMSFTNRVHFFGAAARAMRRILVDHARRRGAVKRGASPLLLPLEELGDEPIRIDLQLDLVALDQALDRLARVAPARAQVVELRYFGGLSVDEAAALLGVAPATVKRHSMYARAWLHRELYGTPGADR